MTVMQEALSYLRTHPALSAAFDVFCQKYRSLGHFGGQVMLPEAMKEADRREIAAFLREDVRLPRRLTWRQCERAWEKTRFAAIPLDAVLEARAGGKIRTRKEEREARERAQDAVLDGLVREFPAGAARRWLNMLGDTLPEHRLTHREYTQDRGLLRTVALALNALPQGRYERIPFFANRVTGNPHAFDEQETAGRVFLQALSWLAGNDARTVEEKNDLLYGNHLVREDIQNFATVYGITAPELPYLRLAAESHSPINLPLREIVRAEKFFPMEDKGKPFRVYIVENSGVFSTLLDALQKRGITVPFLCLQGQLKLASWAVLDRLAAAGGAFYYSGDFDPEGLGMADRVLQRCPSAHAWHYGAEEYRPEGGAVLPESRLAKLDGIQSAQLLPAAGRLMERKQAYYQESFVQDLLHDMIQPEE